MHKIVVLITIVIANFFSNILLDEKSEETERKIRKQAKYLRYSVKLLTIERENIEDASVKVKKIRKSKLKRLNLLTNFIVEIVNSRAITSNILNPNSLSNDSIIGKSVMRIIIA